MRIETSTLATLALFTVIGCDADEPLLLDDERAEIEDEVGDGDVFEKGEVESLTQGSGSSAFPGFGVAISVADDDVVLDWSATGPQGSAVSVYRSTDPTDLLDEAALAGAEQITLPVGTTSYTDVGAAAHDQPTPDLFYRVVVETGGSDGLSTMLMKKTTAMAPGYVKFGMCMLGGPSHASDLVDRLGSSASAVWSWDAASQSYVGWNPSMGIGTAADYALPLGGVFTVQIDGTTPSHQSLVGVVPTDETFAVSGEPGLNWSVLPVLYDGPTSASYWVDTVGYWGMGLWNSLTQSASWYWNSQYQDFDVELCQPYYTHLNDDACTSNADCSADSFCDFDVAAACGDVAAGLCKARPLGCEFATGGEVCGCDGAVYDNACEAELAGASVTDGTPTIGTSFDATADFQYDVPSEDLWVPGDYSCGPGYELVTTADAIDRNAELCGLLGTWDIVRLADGGSMGGPGYGCVVFEDDPRGMGASLCTTAHDDDGWHFLYDADGTHDYREMTVGDTYWGHQAWRDETCTDAVFLLDPADSSQLIAHPPSVNGCNGWSTAAWEAPSDGTADVQITIEEDDTCIGGGVDLEIRDDGGTLLWSHYDTAMGVVYEYDALADVAAGERLYLRIAHGPGGSWCDTTDITFSVEHHEGGLCQ